MTVDFLTLFLLILFLEVVSGKVPNNFACTNITLKSVFSSGTVFEENLTIALRQLC